MRARHARAPVSWYRRTVDLPGSLGGRHLGLWIGKVDSSYQVFAGGLLLGGVGSVPPDGDLDYDRHAVYPVPAEAIGAGGRLTVALRIGKSDRTLGTVGVPHEGPFSVGPWEEVLRADWSSELLQLVLASLYFVAGLFYLELNRRFPYALSRSFALLSLGFALYSLLRTQWKYAVFGDRFVLLKEIEHGLVPLLAILFVELVWPVLGLEVGRFLRGLQGAFAVLGVLAILPGLRLGLVLLPVVQAGVLVLVAIGVAGLVRSARQRHPEARIVAVGTLASAACFLHDIGVDRGLFTGHRITAFGFALLLLSLALSLANRFSRNHQELRLLRQDLESRVRERTAQLEQANRALGEFLSTMSHEIRTPLNGLAGTVDLLRSTDVDRVQAEYLEIARASTKALLSLVEDILQLSRIEAGRLDTVEVPVDLIAWFDESVLALWPLAHTHGLDVAASCGPGLPARVGTDPNRLRQVLLNLAGNALKFTGEGGVWIDLEHEETGPGRVRLRLSITDTGPGVPEEAREAIFESFHQARRPTLQAEGTGLGLTISRRIARALGGDVVLASSEPGRGSVFVATVDAAVLAGPDGPGPGARGGRTARLAVGRPLSARALERQLGAWGWTTLAEDPTEVAGPCELLLTDDVELARREDLGAARRLHLRLPGAEEGPAVESLVLPVRPGAFRAALAGPERGEDPAADEAVDLGLRVLVVDDDDVNRLVARAVLVQLGCTVELAVDGVEALERLAEEPLPDAVLLDLQMPRLDGHETLARIRADRRLAPLRVLALTADAFADVDRLRREGFDRLLFKPTTRRGLVEALLGKAD